MGNFAIGVSGGSFSFLASDSNTKLLQNPQIRALNDQKATLRIGDRVPIATGSFAGTVGGTGVSPLVSTQFQYLDVGVNIDITPHIHSDSEVTLKMTLEISSVTGQQSIGGITQPIIGQRRIDHESRLADGEVNLLGGILEDSETQSMSGYPWLSRLPILKYLFAQDNKERTENEIVFAITPHIIRAQEVTEDNLRVIDIGTGNSIELRRKPSAPAASTSAHPADAAKPGQPAPQAPPAAAPAPGASLPVTPSPASLPGQGALAGARPATPAGKPAPAAAPALGASLPVTPSPASLPGQGALARAQPATPAGKPAEAGEPTSYQPNRFSKRAGMYYGAVWGVDSLGVKLVESGEMIRFSYRVLDADKAKALNDKKLEPSLIDDAVGAKLVVPSVDQAGPLRQSGAPQAGKSYSMAFSNKGKLVKRGDRVTVAIGPFKAEGLVVE